MKLMEKEKQVGLERGRDTRMEQEEERREERRGGNKKYLFALVSVEEEKQEKKEELAISPFESLVVVHLMEMSKKDQRRKKEKLQY